MSDWTTEVKALNTVQGAKDGKYDANQTRPGLRWGMMVATFRYSDETAGFTDEYLAAYAQAYGAQIAEMTQEASK